MDEGFFDKAFQAIFDERGHVNLLVINPEPDVEAALIDTVFQGNVASLGRRKKVNSVTTMCTRNELPFTVFFVSSRKETTIEQLGEFKELLTSRTHGESPTHIHIAWACFTKSFNDENTTRTADFASLTAEHIPTVGVAVGSTLDESFKSQVKHKLPTLENVLQLKESELRNAGTIADDQGGLSKLVQFSSELVPDDQRTAFIMAQRIDCSLKRESAMKIVSKNAVLAGGIGAIPVPGADALALLPLQARMLARISSVYMASTSSAFPGLLATIILGGAIATATGRLVVGSLKLIPGVGTILGSVISASTAAALTTGLGATYISIFDALCNKNLGESPSEKEVLGEIEKRFKRSKDDEGESGQDEADEEDNPDHRSR